MNKITEQFLKIVSDFKGSFDGAFSIRENGECAARQSTANIQIDSKADAPGLVVHVKPGTKGERYTSPPALPTAISTTSFTTIFISARGRT